MWYAIAILGGFVGGVVVTRLYFNKVIALGKDAAHRLGSTIQRI